MSLLIHPRTIEILAYGDAFGLPYETLSKPGLSDLDLPLPMLIAPGRYSTFEDFDTSPVGTWSDDTQHAVAVVESLEFVGDYSLVEIALRLRREMDISSKGWGGTTRKAIGRVHELMSTGELRRNGDTEGRGCGPLMRSVPLTVFCQARDSEALVTIAEENALLTHNNPDNIASTVTHHQVLAFMMSGKVESVCGYALERAVENEEKYGASSNLSDTLRHVIDGKDIAMAVYGDNVVLAFTTWSVQAMSYASFDKYDGPILLDVLTNVVMEGGDTDSTGSIVASMWALKHPDGELPADIDLLESPERLQKASRFLCGLLK